MYFSSLISVNPKQLTEIEIKPPQKAFKRILYKMGLASPEGKVEHQTFCALSILQSINSALRAMKVTNVVKLTKDNVIFFEDKEGKKDDLKAALEAFELDVDKVEAACFQQLNLVVERSTEDFKFFIDITINRSHEVGEYPIEIQVDGLLRAFQDAGNDSNKIKAEMQEVLGNDEAYHRFVSAVRLKFDAWIAELKLQLSQSIGVRDIHVETEKVLLRPQQPVTQANWWRRDKVSKPGDFGIRRSGRGRRNYRHRTPVFTGYFGLDHQLLYAWLWAEHCYNHDILLNDVSVVNERGELCMEIEEDGYRASQGQMLNVENESEAHMNAWDGASEIENPDNEWDAGFDEGSHGSDSDVTTRSSGGSGFFDWVSDAPADSGDSGVSSACGSSCGGCGGGD